MTFENAVVWITGASSGIGAALAHDASRRGAQVILSARRAEQLEAVRESCLYPERHTVLPLDLGDLETLPAQAETALAVAGRVDVMIHNGGISQRALAVDTAVEVDERIMRVNYLSTVVLTKALLPSMLERGRGHLIVVSSLVGKFGTPLRSGYAASKHALHGFYDSLRAEIYDDGLRVTIGCPGFIRTQISVNALTGEGAAQGTMDQAQANGMPPEVCARHILDAAEHEKAEVYIGGRETLGVYAKRWVPALFRRVIRKAAVT